MAFVSLDKFFFNNFKYFKSNYTSLNPKSSKRSISLVLPFFTRPNFGKVDSKFFKLIGKKKSDIYIFNRFLKVNTFLIGNRVGVYTGRKFQSFKIYPFFLGVTLNNFIQTHKLVNNKSNLKKKGRSANNSVSKKKK